jgi:flagellar hook-associated protein 3 FlgL
MSGAIRSIYETVSFALYLHDKAMAQLQEQASTGARVNRASDSPSDAYRILGLDSQERSLDSYMERMTETSSTLEVTSTIISDMMTQLSQVKTNLTQIIGGTYSREGQLRLADAINNTLEQLVSLANTQHSGQYLFGGSDTGSAPYIVERSNGEIVGISYQGSSEQRNVELAPGVKASAFYVGGDIFSSDSREEPVFSGNTGAKTGSGTSSIRGDVWLTVIHDGSNYKLSIDDGASYTTVPVGGDNNLAVKDSRTGRVLYVDTTGLNNTGVEMVRVPGTYDVFGTLMGIRDLLKNDQGLSKDQLQKSLDDYVNSVEEVRNLLVQAGVSVGMKIGFLTNLKDNLENMKQNTQDESDRLSQADIAQLAIDLSREQMLYQMSLSVAGKLMSISLMDYIE